MHSSSMIRRQHTLAVMMIAVMLKTLPPLAMAAVTGRKGFGEKEEGRENEG